MEENDYQDYLAYLDNKERKAKHHYLTNND
jgi:hypothetical protein